MQTITSFISNALYLGLSLFPKDMSLHQAVLAGDLELLRSILEQSYIIDLNVINDVGATALHLAVDNRDDTITVRCWSRSR